MHLLEAREEINEREAIMKEKEHMINLVRREKDDLAKENEVNGPFQKAYHVIFSVFSTGSPLSESQR